MASGSEFIDFSDPPAISRYTKDKWYQDHGKEFIYSPDLVGDFRYQDGINMGRVEDGGEWIMLPSSKEGNQNDPSTWFLGWYAWIEEFNSQHGYESAKDDDPEHGHISVDLSSIRALQVQEPIRGSSWLLDANQSFNWQIC